MKQFLWGALTMASAVAAVFFLRYWRMTHDRLFAFFSIAFIVLALNWLALAIVDPNMETRHILYILRLVAFVLIIVGIVDKNRRGTPS